MTVHRVFIAWSYPLFNESTRRLLEHPNVEIVGTSSNFAGLQPEIDALRPDIIILEKTDENAADPMVILETATWGPRIFCMGLQDNELQIYSSERHIVEQSEDLLHLIFDR